MFLSKQISSLHKVREFDSLSMNETTKETVLRGERFTYQISMRSDAPVIGNIKIESPLLDHIKIYKVEQSVMDAPVIDRIQEIGYITTEPGLMPDLLLPLDNNGYLTLNMAGKTVWIEVNIPNDFPAGEYTIKFSYETFDFNSFKFGDRDGGIPAAESKGDRPDHDGDSRSGGDESGRGGKTVSDPGGGRNR